MTEQPHEYLQDRAARDAIFQRLMQVQNWDEALHIEHFLDEVFEVTPEEHDQAAQWLMSDQTDPMPPSLQRIQHGVLLNERFLTLVSRYNMNDNEVRQAVVYKLCINGREE